MNNLLVFIFFILYLIAYLLLSGLVILKYWQWFFVPLFNLPQINIYYAIAFWSILSFLKGSNYIDYKEDLKATFTSKIIKTTLILFIGYILYLSI